MDPRRNPFNPTAGARPPAFEGREKLLEDADIALDRLLGGLHANSMMLTGLRGVGKTVLLNRIQEDAKSKGYETAKFEVPDDRGGHLAAYATRHLGTILARLDRFEAARQRVAGALDRLQAFASQFDIKIAGHGAKVAAPATVAAPDLEFELPELLIDVAKAAEAKGSAVALFIDEVQYLSKKELSALARACHEIAQVGAPMILFATGLPQIRALSGDAKSYAERLFDFRDVGPLEPDAARRALTEPVAQQGAAFDDAALDLILQQTAGYAYFLQAWGKHAWDEAETSPITRADVEQAELSILSYMDESFFRVRFDRCTPKEQRYLRAMAELGPGPHRSGDIADAAGHQVNEVAPVRRALISSGMIFSQRHGETAFTVPLFDDFMKRVMPDLPDKGLF